MKIKPSQISSSLWSILTTIRTTLGLSYLSVLMNKELFKWRVLLILFDFDLSFRINTSPSRGYNFMETNFLPLWMRRNILSPGLIWWCFILVFYLVLYSSRWILCNFFLWMTLRCFNLLQWFQIKNIKILIKLVDVVVVDLSVVFLCLVRRTLSIIYESKDRD